MFFHDLTFKDTFLVIIVTFLLGVALLFFLFLLLRQKDEYQLQIRNTKRILKASLIGGVAFSFLSSIITLTITPKIVTVENGHNYSKKISFTGNEGFLGFGGCYIVNNSDKTIKVMGIDEDKDINVIIKPNKSKKIRILPEEYFNRIPTSNTKASHTIRYVRGKRRPIKGHSVFLFDYEIH